MDRTMNKHVGTAEYIAGIFLGIGHLATKDDILFVLSFIATSMAIINYYFSIKKNAKRERVIDKDSG